MTTSTKFCFSRFMTGN
ncbi:peptide IlvX [Enterobacter hormaechei]|nr:MULTISPECIES: peptide IlvX [Enterobacteriaceae]MBE3302256.1 hypothetical protein [Enterobacter cloacae complex sp. P30U]MBE3536469.1 hypothetical protein [Enterobacter cloacae complex sp. I3]MBE4901836.1 hypothetical protein [Enterobacter cloacae complex sp. P8RS]MBU5511910.1 peptide IlvX [Enterobacteriaceae bacterium S18_ASV_15]MBU5539681.1 peptide IlvX [Pluralibacter sp. S10_ASV_43]MBU5621220.1 peptide IlvX [Enterobacteriaceae bacterium S5_ASV_15]MBU5633100.1 peptide IlvX [Enterobacteri